MLGYERCTVVEEGLTGRTTVFDDPFDPELNGMKSMARGAAYGRAD